MTHHSRISSVRALLALVALSAGALLATSRDAVASVPGITGTVAAGTVTFNLQATATMITQPDGASIYSFGYGCLGAPGGYMPAKLAAVSSCGAGQIPGPTLIVTEGQLVTVNLTNNLPAGAGNVSVIFSGQRQNLATTTPAANYVLGELIPEALPGKTITYKFQAGGPGTYEYHSGTRSELQVEMGLYGVLIVLPNKALPPAPNPQVPLATTCGAFTNSTTGLHKGQPDYRLASHAYDHPQTCYDREYLFQLTEMDSRIHVDVQNQLAACATLLVATPTATCPSLIVNTDPYHPNYFLINGRSMPDDMDPAFAPQYPNQPYNGNPHMHPGETMLIRQVAHGRLQHPLHIHANHARVLARDGNLLLSATDGVSLAGPLVFTFPTVSGQAVDALFGWTGKGLNWDVYGHAPPAGSTIAPGPSNAGNGDPHPCIPDANGFYTNASVPAAQAGVTPNYGEWCADHNRPIPVTPPDPQIVANGLWYGGTPYLGVTTVASGRTHPLVTPLPPGFSNQNPSAGYAYMWHSHNEREITTNDVFPGGMMMMLIIDPPKWQIDESL